MEGENHIGSAIMQKAASSNLVFTDFFSFKRLAELEERVSHAGLYQGIARTFIRDFHTECALTGLATKLAFVGDHAYSIRQPDIVGDVGAGVASIKKDGMLVGEVVVPVRAQCSAEESLGGAKKLIYPFAWRSWNFSCVIKAHL